MKREVSKLCADSLKTPDDNYRLISMAFLHNRTAGVRGPVTTAGALRAVSDFLGTIALCPRRLGLTQWLTPRGYESPTLTFTIFGLTVTVVVSNWS